MPSAASCRLLPAADILISHVSINFDRTGFQRDLNVVYPIDRLRELVAEGVIGGVAETHFTVMGSTDPGRHDGGRGSDRWAVAAGTDRCGSAKPCLTLCTRAVCALAHMLEDREI